MKPIYLLSISIILAVVFSCSKENLEEANDDSVHLSLFEEISETGERNLQFRLKTAKIYPCVNFSLDMSSTFQNDGMQAVIQGVNESVICLTALGPASGFIDWQQPANGSYPLDFKIFGKSNTGVLIVDEKGYTVELAQQNNLILDTEKLLKIPSNTIWGTVGYSSTSLDPKVAEFFGELEALGATALKLPEGNYGHFNATEGGDMAVPENHGYYHIKTLLYNFAGDNDALQALLKKYGNGDIYIGIYSAAGGYYYSWGQ